MIARTYYRCFRPSREQWESLTDAGREYVRRVNTPVYYDSIPHVRAVVAQLLALHYPQIARGVIDSPKWQRLARLTGEAQS